MFKIEIEIVVAKSGVFLWNWATFTLLPLVESLPQELHFYSQECDFYSGILPFLFIYFGADSKVIIAIIHMNFFKDLKLSYKKEARSFDLFIYFWSL